MSRSRCFALRLYARLFLWVPPDFNFSRASLGSRGISVFSTLRMMYSLCLPVTELITVEMIWLRNEGRHYPPPC